MFEAVSGKNFPDIGDSTGKFSISRHCGAQFVEERELSQTVKREFPTPKAGNYFRRIREPAGDDRTLFCVILEAIGALKLGDRRVITTRINSASCNLWRAGI
jgi:hypothetical protein